MFTRRLIHVVLSCGLAIGPCSALANETSNWVQVSGNASLPWTPDSASLTLQIDVEDRNSGNASDELEKRITQIRNALLSKTSLTAKNIDTANYQLNPLRKWNDKTRQQELFAYRASRQIQLTIDDIQQLPKLYAVLAEHPISSMQNLRWSNSKLDQVQAEALALAVKNAQLNASAMARAAAQCIGAAQTLSAQSYQPEPQPMPRMLAMAEVARADQDSFQITEQSLNASVTARFALMSECSKAGLK